MGQMLGCVKVKESNVGIKEVFEKFDEVLQPGCHYVPWYLGRRVTATHSLGFKHFNVCAGAKTKDNVFVTVVAKIQYRVLEEMVVEAHYFLDNQETHISLYVSNAIKTLVPKFDLDSIFEQRNEIATAVQKEIEKDMSAAGFVILKIFLSYTLHESVRKAMTDAVKLRVETKEMLQLKREETAAELKYLRRLRMTRQFQAIADGVSDSKLAFSETEPDASAATVSKDIMEIVLANHYFDTVKEVSASGKYNAVFVANGNVAVKDIASQVKDGLFLLQGNSASASEINNAPLEINGKTPPTKS